MYTQITALVGLMLQANAANIRHRLMLVLHVAQISFVSPSSYIRLVPIKHTILPCIVRECDRR
jgi:hypothetical protein